MPLSLPIPRWLPYRILDDTRCCLPRAQMWDTQRARARRFCLAQNGVHEGKMVPAGGVALGFGPSGAGCRDGFVRICGPRVFWLCGPPEETSGPMETEQVCLRMEALPLLLLLCVHSTRD